MIIPFLFGLAALSVLFFKLPGVPELFGILNCTSCSTTTPYIPMLAASYFAALITCILCFRTLPSKPLKWGGFVWAIGLSVTLTALSSQWCLICLIAHGCHSAIWIFWKPTQKESEKLVGMKLALAFTSSIAVMGLFSTLNFTFLVYGLQLKNPISGLVKEGSLAKSFTIETLSSKDLGDYRGVVLHFISANCPYCKEQIPKLDSLAKSYHDKGFRFINVSQKSVPELEALGSHLEWIEDSHLSSLFGVQGYPTMILLGPSGTVLKASAGASPDFEKILKKQLQTLQ